jgi:hypothetical protein
MVGQVQDQTTTLRRGTDYHCPDVQRSQSDVAMPETLVDWPPRDGAVASPVRQSDRHRMGSPDRGSDDPRQTARLGPSGASLSDWYSVVSSAAPSCVDSFARSGAMVAPIPQPPKSVVIRIADSTMLPREFRPVLGKIDAMEHHIHHKEVRHPHDPRYRKVYRVGNQPGHLR